MCLSGLNNGPKKTCSPKTSEYVLFGIRFFADVVKVSMLRSMTGIFVRERRGKLEARRGRPCEYRGRD